ncbi:type II secretory ATPase GspE/PulE/Tfp pilus assembly ATPase PilB-like protein [Paraburkholderia youngii]|uniref:hypothetical protein n=1 Tax=Paraburkholderia youngii TaxID=2782701 RepID=UPI003D1FE29D
MDDKKLSELALQTNARFASGQSVMIGAGSSAPAVNSKALRQSLTDLGYNEAAQAKLDSILGGTGSITIAGPTGSGKSAYAGDIVKSLGDAR